MLQGTPGITSGKAYSVSGDLRATLGTMPNGNGSVQCTLGSANWTTDPADMLFRVTDTNNYLALLITSPTVCSLRSRITGSLATLSSFAPSPSLVNGSPTTMKIVVNGTTVMVFQNGVLLSGSTTTLTGGAAALSGTAAGIWSSTAQITTTFDDYSVLP